jgi:hypothetical protein
LPGAGGRPPDPDGVLQWLLANQQQALQVVQQLQAINPQRLECVWPQGQRMRIQAQAGLAAATFEDQAQERLAGSDRRSTGG